MCCTCLGCFHFKQTSTIQDAKNVKGPWCVLFRVNLTRVDVMYKTFERFRFKCTYLDVMQMPFDGFLVHGKRKQ